MSLSKELFNLLSNSASLNVVLFKPLENGMNFEFVLFSDCAEKTDNIDKKEVIGKRLTEVFPGAEDFGFLELLQRVYQTGKKEIFEDKLYSDHRISGWRRNEVEKLSDGTILVFYNDTTLQKTAEDQLSSLGLIIEESLNEVYIFDQETLLFTYANQGAQKNIGYSMQELKEKTPIDVKPDFNKEKFTKLIEPLIKGSQTKLIFETLHQRKNGTFYNIECSLHAITQNGVKRIVTLALDVTERKLTEKILQNNIHKLERAEEMANIGLWEWNFVTGETLWSNQTYKIFGEKPQSFPPSKEVFFSYLYEEDKKILSKAIEESIETGAIYKVEHKIRLKDSSTRYLQGWGEISYDESGTAVKLSGAYLDITEKQFLLDELKHSTKNLQKKVTKEVQKNQEQTMHIFQQSRLAQMGEMISMIAHQWRQPLSSISAISNTLTLDLMTQNYNEDFFTSRLGDINQLSQHLSSTIDDFRNFFKREQEEVETTFLTVLRECLTLIGPMLKSSAIKVMKNIDEDPIFHTHHNEIKQVVLNIIKNAEDAIQENKIENPKISVNIFQKNNYAVMQIEDNAGGIPEHIINNIFNPYFSTKKEKDGTGLGLYMSKTIVEEHCKGSLQALNINNGVRFSIKLPIT